MRRLITIIIATFAMISVNAQQMTYSPSATRFALWSPDADSVKVNIYLDAKSESRVNSISLNKSVRNGVWSIIEKGDFIGKYYTFQVKYKGRWLEETAGPDARAVGINGKRAAIVDMQSSNPKGWENDKAPYISGVQDAVIYEMHHRDFSMDEQSGIMHKGKFLALTETATHNEKGLPTGIDHLKEFGITHVHLLPSYDFGSINEATGDAVSGGGRSVCKYNWGYDPVNYNVPEGSYSTDADNPITRIREFKQMVMALHKAGIRVVMDVVYNHVFDHDKSAFQLTAPGKYFRYNDDGTPANGSGCGNETASENECMSDFIVNSVKYWMTEYHIDGFRFDLMGIHDIETMNKVREAAQAIDPNVMLYGEGWAASSPALPEEKLAMKANTAKLGGIAAFGDEMRDGLRGVWNNDEEGAFLVGVPGNEESVKFGIVGAIAHPQVEMEKVNYSKTPWAAEPTQMISYVSCHDDLCITDRLIATSPSKENVKALLKLAETVVLTSQGVPLLWCGDEIMRDRRGVHNCFSSPDSVNAIPWANKTLHMDVFEYVKGLISLRKAHPAFHMGDSELVRNNLTFLPTPKKKHNVIAYHLNGNAVGDEWGDIIVIYNSNPTAIKQSIPQGTYTIAVKDGMVGVNERFKGKQITVPASSAMILYR